MKPTPYITEIPDSLYRKVAQQKEVNIIIHKEVIDGDIWAWRWYDKSHWGDQSRNWTFERLCILNKNGQTLSWDGEKWCQKKLISRDDYWKRILIDENPDKELFGNTIEEVQDRKRIQAAERREYKKELIIQDMLHREKPYSEKIDSWIHEKMKHYIIFEVSNRELGWCTHCEMYGRFKKLKYKAKTKCPNCGKTLECTTPSKAPEKSEKIFIFSQKVKGGLMIRFVWRMRYNRIGETVYTENEVLRLFINKDGKQTWFEKRKWYQDEWMTNSSNTWVKTYNGPYATYLAHGYNDDYRPEVYGSLKDLVKQLDNLKYIKDGALKMIDTKAEHDLQYEFNRDFFEKMLKVKKYLWLIDLNQILGVAPQIESLYKCGFTKLASEIAMNRAKTGTYSQYREVDKFLGVKKETWREMLKCLWKETFSSSKLNAWKDLEDTNIPISDYESITRIFNPAKIAEILNTCSRYGFSEKKAISYLRDNYYQGTRYWCDYIRMASEFNIDLTDPFNWMSNDIEEAHDALVEQKEYIKAQEEIEKQKKLLSAFEKLKKELKAFNYEKEDLFIRPAASPEEIILEGQSQHNCVGRAGYTEKMIKRKSFILFLRKKDNPEESYYTVEVTPKGKLLQAYAKYNQKTDDYDTKIKPMLKDLEKKVRKVNAKYLTA